MDALSFLLGLLLAIPLVALGFWWLLGRRTGQAFAAGRDSQAAELARSRADAEHRQAQLSELRALLAETQDELRRRAEQHAQAGQALATARAQIDALEPLRDQLLASAAESARLQQALAAAEARYAAQLARIEEQNAATSEKLAFIDHARSQLSDQFKVLANTILEQKSERFAAQNIEQVGRILEPLREQLRVFQAEVGEARRQEGEHHVLLHKELDNLRGANQKLGAEAANLINALRGDSRAQGAWGELVLERLLESAGLESGREFETQLVINDHDQLRKRPDVVLRLPEGRDVVIDSKVSLTAYEQIGRSDDQDQRDRLLGQHVLSMAKHLDDLAERRYSELPGLRSLDFVLMFVPIEAAYLDAMRFDPGLYDRALARGVVIASPGMLLAILRTVKHLWRSDDRQNNAQRIAERAGRLFDQFHALLLDIEAIGRAIDTAAEKVDSARRRIKTGRGNLIRRVEELRKLGAKTDKSLPVAYLEQELEGESEEEGEEGEGA